MHKLKPCPFCGEEVEINKRIMSKSFSCLEKDKVFYTIHHIDLLKAVKNKCPIEMVSYRTKEGATAFWNKRAKHGNVSLWWDKPKHCPFCGEQVEVINDEWLDGTPAYEIYHCGSCCDVFEEIFDTEKEADV